MVVSAAVMMTATIVAVIHSCHSSSFLRFNFRLLKLNLGKLKLNFRSLKLVDQLRIVMQHPFTEGVGEKMKVG